MLNICINMLQIPCVYVEDVEIVFPLRRAEALIYYMVCNRTATRKELVDLFWDSCDDVTGRRNLRNAMYILKKVFGVDVLLTHQKTTVLFNPELAVNCDYIRFMEQEDISAYNGLFLNGFDIKNASAFYEWVGRIRDKVRERYLAYLSKLVQNIERQGALARAERCAIDYLREEPADEKMCVLLMNLYRNQARYPKAINAYQKLHTYLEKELGTAPMAETTQVYYQILNEWNATTVNANQSEPQNLLLPAHKQLLHLLQGVFYQFEKSGTDKPHIHISGVGMNEGSSLIDEALRRSGFASTRIFHGRCFQTNSNHPYHVWQLILMDLLQFAKDRDIALPDKLRNYLPETILHGDLHKDERVADAATVENFLRLVYLVLREQKMILLLQDLQWADCHSTALLNAMLRRFSTGRLLIVTLGSEILPPHVQSFLGCARQDGLLLWETIPDLEYEDIFLLIQEQYGDRIARMAAKQVLEETAGNAYLVRYVLQPARSNNEAALFERIRTLLDKRITQLSHNARKILNMLSFFPDGAAYRVLEALCNLEVQEIDVACKELMACNFLSETDRGGFGVLVFQNRVIQERVYHQHSMLERQGIHERIAQAVCTQTPAPSPYEYEQIRYHLAKIGKTEKALICVAAKLFQVVSGYYRRLPLSINEKSDFGRTVTPLLTEASSGIFSIERMTVRSDSMEQCLHRLQTLEMAITLLTGRCDFALKRAAQLIEAGNATTVFQLFQYFYRYFRFFIQAKAIRPITDACQDLAACNSESVCVFSMWLQGVLLGLCGEYDSAGVCLQSAVDKAPVHSVERAGILHAMGKACWWNKETNSAYSLFQEAIKSINEPAACTGLYALYLDCSLAATTIGDDVAAQQIAHNAYEIAIKAMDDLGIVASCAHLSVLYASDEAMAQLYLSRAMETADRDSPYEQGLITYAFAKLRFFLDRRESASEGMNQMLGQPFFAYARKALLLLSSVKDNLEHEDLRALFASAKQ